MISKVIGLLLRILVAMALVLTVWLVLANMTNIKTEFLVLPVALLGVISACILVPESFVSRVVGFFGQNRKALLALIIGLTVVSVGLRFSFLAFEYAPFSDPEHFYIAAKDLASDGFLDRSYVYYVANYPYLYSYDVLLAKSMEVFGQGTLAVIALNTLLDLVGAGLLYVLIRIVSRSKTAALVGMMLWIISPFNIIFSAISLPVIAVNTLIIASLLAVCLLLLNLNNLKFLIPLSIVTGVLFAMTNAFRPFMVVFIIGLVIYWLIYFIEKPSFKKVLNLDVALIGVLLPFFMINTIYSQAVSDQTDLPPTTSSGGWSIFVGANYGESGKWNQEDSTYGTKVFSEAETANEAHRQLQREGIERYMALSPGELVDFGLKKSIALGGDVQNSIYNIDTYPDIWENDALRSFIWVVCTVYVYMLLLFTIRYLAIEFKSKLQELDFIHYLAMVFVGLFMALLLVEVANRYFTPFFVFLTIFASLGIVFGRRVKRQV